MAATTTMSAIPAAQDGPVPLTLPSILVNPRNKALAQVEAYNAQQREKAAAKRQAAHNATVTQRNLGVGKRVLRRRENAMFYSNPHIHPPSKGDLLPSAPPHVPQFPLPAPHNSGKTPIPPSIPGSSIPDPESTRMGGFTTSLKGVRKALRGRGRRAEVVILRAERELKEWHAESGWKVIDETLVELSSIGITPNSSESQARILPHSPSLSIPPFLLSQSAKPAITSLAQTPAHQIWYVPDPFDRWIVHLLCRYWDLVSWSAPAPSPFTEGERVTHIVKPEIAFARPMRRGPVGGPVRGMGMGLMTPETTDLSASGTEAALSSSTDTETETETEVDTETDGEGEGDTTFRLSSPSTSPTPTAPPPLRRSMTSDSEDYMYPASDEGDWSETDSLSGALGDSLVLEPADGGWESVKSIAPPRRGTGIGNISEERKVDKPSFFDYLYGS